MRKRLQRGQVLPIMGVLMIGMMGLTGLVTDIGTYFFQNRVQQNAAEAASRAATSYWYSRLSTATDRELWCVAQLYASSASYQSLVPGQCPASTTSIPDNEGKGVGVYYVDISGNQLGAVGTHGTTRPVLIAGNATATGIRVTTSATSGAFFSRVFNISGFAVNDTATNRMGLVGSVLNPPGSSGALKVLPAAFQLTTYQTTPLYGPPSGTVPGSQIKHFSVKCGDFCWSGLQCTGNNGNSTISYWLVGD
ncbi:MAG: pilus assembly protein TadG-related protein, partial [Candidatus Dormibacteria bacterium]